VDVPVIRRLVDAGIIVVASGGGGVPVVRDTAGNLTGVEAVLDKDLTAALLATALGAESLIIATDVEQVVVDYGTPQARPLGSVSVNEMEALARAGHFPVGSMGPKVQALIRFVAAGGSRAIITSLENIDKAVLGGTGTVVEGSRSRRS